MAGIVQLAAGGTAQAPQGAVSIKLSSPARAQLVLMRADGQVVEPDFRKSDDEVVLLPREPVVVTARSSIGQPFPAGTRIGVTFRSPSGAGAEIVRPGAEVGGHQAVMLARIDADGLIHDALADGRRGSDGEGLFARDWMKPGSYAYHVNHHQGPAGDLSWSLVLDASASILVEHRREGLGRFLETLIGIVSTAFGSEPTAVLTATEPVRDAVDVLHSDEIDWYAALGRDPAAWARVTHAAREADGVGAVVVVIDGVPVDYRELTQWAAQTSAQVFVVAVGRSRYGLRPEDKPTQFWEEELAALDDLAALERVRVVSTADLDSAAQAADALADSLFPVRRGA